MIGEAHLREGARGLVWAVLSLFQDGEDQWYDRLAVIAPEEIIFEALSFVEGAAREGKVRKSRGALFLAIVNRACADGGVVVGQHPLGAT